MATSSFDINQRVAEALGLDLKEHAVTRIVLAFDARLAPTAQVTYQVSEPGALAELLQHYKLVPDGSRGQLTPIAPDPQTPEEQPNG